jgi:MFS family permease
MPLKSVIADRNARLFLAVTLVAGFGTSAMSLTSSVWVLSLTGSASLAALCGLCLYAPSLAGPMFGTLVDRLPRRRLLLTTCTAMALLLGLLVAVHPVWLVFAVMCGYGVAEVLIDAGESAIVQAVVPADRLGGLNSLRTGVQEGLKLVAPLAGAALFAWSGGAPVAGLAAVCLLGSAQLYRKVHMRQTPMPPRSGVWRQTGQGLGHLFGQPVVRDVVLAAGVAVAAAGLSDAAAFVVLTRDLHRPPAFAGVLGAAQGFGSIVGALAGGRLLERLGERRVAAIGCLLAAVGSLALCVPVTAVNALARVAIGIGLPWTVVAAFTAVQRYTDQSMIGRVAASATTIVFAPLALTISAGAGLIAVADHRVPLILGAVARVVAGTVLLRRRPQTVVPLSRVGMSTADNGG